MLLAGRTFAPPDFGLFCSTAAKDGNVDAGISLVRSQNNIKYTRHDDEACVCVCVALLNILYVACCCVPLRCTKFALDAARIGPPTPQSDAPATGPGVTACGTVSACGTTSVEQIPLSARVCLAVSFWLSVYLSVGRLGWLACSLVAHFVHMRRT